MSCGRQTSNNSILYHNNANPGAPFVKVGIPYGYFEATNWEIGELDGYTQTEKDGEIWHTEKDTISYIEENYPGRIDEHLNTFSQVLSNLLKHMNPPCKKN